MTEKMFYDTGEKVPAGIYCCVSCSDTVEVGTTAKGKKGVLPECACCGMTQWQQVMRMDNRK